MGKKCLVHEFYVVAEVPDCVDVVCLIGRGQVAVALCWRGHERETPELCDGVERSSEEVWLAIIEVASGGLVGDGVAGITENGSGKKG